MADTTEPTPVDTAPVARALDDLVATVTGIEDHPTRVHAIGDLHGVLRQLWDDTTWKLADLISADPPAGDATPGEGT